MRWLVALLLAAAPASSGEPPAPNATAFACTRGTMLAGRTCTLEGQTAPQPPSKEQAKENQRQARVIAAELCNSLARGEAVEPDRGILAACTARIPAATRGCGGDGSRRLVDEAGRFNPGHARCYASLAALARTTAALVDQAGSCCACLADACQAGEEQCVARIADERAPDVPAACLQGACAADCAQARLFGATRKP